MKYVLAAHALLPQESVDPSCDDLECRDLAALERRFVPRRPRHVGRVTRMACIGACACLQQYTRGTISGTGLGLFHGTSIGNLREVREVQKQVVREPDELPSPIRFVRSLGNLSAFFAAQVTGALGPNLLVSQGDFSFEGALVSAQLSGQLGEVDFALVGASDGRSGTREEHLAMLGYSADTRTGEGSGWLLLGQDATGARAELVHVELLGKGKSWVSAAEQVVREVRRVEESLWILPGLRVDSGESQELAGRLPGARVRGYLGRTGIYPTAAACGIADLLSGPREPGLYVHGSGSENGREALIVLRALP